MAMKCCECIPLHLKTFTYTSSVVVLKNSININIYNINNNKMQFLRVSNASSHAATVVPECYKEYYQMFTRLVFFIFGGFFQLATA